MVTDPAGEGHDRYRTHRRFGLTNGRSDFGRWKRVAAGLAGVVLLVRGLRRRSLRGIATALAGGWLLARALGVERRIGRSRDGLAGRGSAERGGPTAATAVSRSITIDRPADELYEAWRDPDRFSQVVGHVAEVTSLDGDRLRWRIDGPRGRDVSGEIRYVEESPGEYLRWESVGETTVPTQGSIHFRPAPGDRGTEVTLSVDVDPPGGALGELTLEKLDIVPGALTEVALRRFKSLVETGEIPTLDRNPSARGAGDWL